MLSFLRVSWTGNSGKAITLTHITLQLGVQRFPKFSQFPWKASQSKFKTSMGTTITKPTGQPSFHKTQSQRSLCNNAKWMKIKGRPVQSHRGPVRRKFGNFCTSQIPAILPTSSTSPTSKKTLHCQISLWPSKFLMAQDSKTLRAHPSPFPWSKETHFCSARLTTFSRPASA